MNINKWGIDFENEITLMIIIEIDHLKNREI